MKYFIIFFWVSITYTNTIAQNLTPAQIVQKQFDAYNQRNLEKFLEPYADSIKIFRFPNQLVYQGKQQMRERYKEAFVNSPALHSTLIDRVILGNTVIDNEYIIGKPSKPATELLVIYKIKNQKIVEMYWLFKED